MSLMLPSTFIVPIFLQYMEAGICRDVSSWSLYLEVLLTGDELGFRGWHAFDPRHWTEAEFRPVYQFIIMSCNISGEHSFYRAMHVVQSAVLLS